MAEVSSTVLELSYLYYQSKNARRLIVENIKEPESREFAIITRQGSFVRKLTYEDSVKGGVVAMFHSVGRFDDPKEWVGMRGYDFVIDIDVEGESIEKVVKEGARLTLEAIDILDSIIGEQPNHINFSGSKGFHIRYDYDTIKDFLPLDSHASDIFGKDEVVSSLSVMVSELVKCADPNIYDAKRLIRCVYSINEKTGLAALPVSEADLYLYNDDPKMLMEEELDFLSTQTGNSEIADEVVRRAWGE